MCLPTHGTLPFLSMQIIFDLIVGGAAEYFVAPDGHDSRAGTQTQPLCHPPTGTAPGETPSSKIMSIRR